MPEMYPRLVQVYKGELYDGNGNPVPITTGIALGPDNTSTWEGNPITDPYIASSSNWNTAFGWGNHLGLYSSTSHTHNFASITAKPTTLVGYGITDAEPVFTKNTAFNKNFGTTTGTVTEGNDSRMVNGQTAFSWGNHTGLYSSSSHTHTFGSLTSRPTTLSGYGITDAELLGHTHIISDVTNLQTALDNKQDDLVSGTNIKTINGITLLGSGDVVINADISGKADISGQVFTGDISAPNLSGTNTGDNATNSNYFPLSGGTVTGNVNITGNVEITGDLTTLNTQTVQTSDNNILLNFNGTHTSAIGGGITIKDGISNGNNLTLLSDSNGNLNLNTNMYSTGLFVNGFNINTIYSAFLHSHTISDITDLQNFTKTISGLVPAPTGVTSTRYLREDGIWVIPTNTTYTEITEAESDATASATLRLITGRRLNSWFTRQKTSPHTFSGQLTLDNAIIKRVYFTPVTATTSGTIISNLSLANIFIYTLTANSTLDYSNPQVGSFTWIITTDGFTLAFAASKFQAEVAPIIAGKVLISGIYDGTRMIISSIKNITDI